MTRKELNELYKQITENMKLPWQKDEQDLTFLAANQKLGTKNIVGHIFDEVGQMPSSIIMKPTQLKYEVKSYPDGSKYVIVKEIHHHLTYRINSYEDLWILNQIHDVVKYAGWHITVTIPNLIDAQADRRFDIDQPHGLKLVLEFLKQMTHFKFKIFHPHNSELVELVLDNRVEVIDNTEFIRNVLLDIEGKGAPEWLLKLGGNKNLILMSADAGGFKPLMKLSDRLEWKGETFSASKSRKYENGHSKLTQIVDRADFGGKDILIVDDLSIGGGTFKGLAKTLRERNCGKLYLAVSHMTIQDLGADPLTNYFDGIYTTNSKFEFYGVNMEGERVLPENLKVYSLFTV